MAGKFDQPMESVVVDGEPVAATVAGRPLRRDPYPHETRAAVDFAGMDARYALAADLATALLETVWLPALTDAAAEEVRATGTDPAALAALEVPPPDADGLFLIMRDVAVDGAVAAAAELAVQGLQVTPPDRAALEERVRAHAVAVARQTADGVALAASRRAVQLAGAPNASADDVADGVRSYLDGLKHQWERDQVAGAVQQAQNAGRFATFEQVEGEPVEVYASEILDAATCEFCEAVDGTVFESLAAGMAAYPSGGFVQCAGGPRCRGTLVLVMADEV